MWLQKLVNRQAKQSATDDGGVYNTKTRHSVRTFDNLVDPKYREDDVNKKSVKKRRKHRSRLKH